MKYLRIDLDRNNTITEVSDQPFSGVSGATKDGFTGVTYNNLLSHESGVTSNYDFPLSQSVYFYRWNGSDVEVNSNEFILLFAKGITHFKLYDYMDNMPSSEYLTSPYNYDFNILGLSKKRVFTKGELNKIDYYGYVDTGGTHQELVLTEYRTFYRKDRMVYMRKMDIDWYLSDDSTGATKTTFKHYSVEESLKLGERRRRNIISDLKISSIGLLELISGLTRVEATLHGMIFLGVITAEITQYIEGMEDPLKAKIMSCSETGCEWLDDVIPNTGGITVRQYLYSGVDIDYSDKIYIT